MGPAALRCPGLFVNVRLHGRPERGGRNAYSAKAKGGEVGGVNPKTLSEPFAKPDTSGMEGGGVIFLNPHSLSETLADPTVV